MALNTFSKNVFGSDKLIGSLALIRSSYLPEDFISTYVPFVATLLVEKNYETINVNQIITDFKNVYGFIIPNTPMITILKKCSAKNIIYRGDDGIFYVNKENAKKLSFTDHAKAETEKYTYILEQLIEHVSKLYTRNISISEAEKMFLSFLEDNSAKTITLNFSEFNSKWKTSKSNYYIVSNFITDASRNKHSLYRLIRDIAVAYLIVSAITFDENDGGTAKEDLCDLILYLDTPFVLRVLGLNTDEMKASCLDLMEELKLCNYTFKIFSHTYDEIINILNDCERWIENPSYEAKHASLALRYFCKKKYNKTDITMYICKLSEELKSLNIEIDDENYYDQKYNSLQIDDVPIRNGIIDTYKKNNPNFDEIAKQNTIECDVKSISAIYKLRKKGTYRTYKDAKYLFLTNNSTLAYVSRIFSSDQNPSDKYNIYPCITDVVLGTKIWLKTPIQRIERFSQKKLLADCMASMTPSEELVNMLSESIESLYERKNITESDYYLLKVYAFDRNYLEKQTLNDEATFNDKITEEILEEIKNEIVSPYNEKIDELDSTVKSICNEKAIISEQLTIIQVQKENEKKEQEEKYASYKVKAKDSVDKLAQFVFPVGVGLIAFSVLFTTKLIKIPSNINTVLSLISGIIGFLSTIIISSIKINIFKCKDKLVGILVEKYLLDEYKKNKLKELIKNYEE